MSNLFLGLFLLSILGLAIGLIRPSLFRLASRKLAALVFGGAIVISFILFGVTAPPTPSVTTNEVAATSTVTSSASSTDTAVTLDAMDVVSNDSQTVSPAITTPSPTLTPTQQNPAPTGQYTYYSVTQVVDGDTIKISMNGSTETIRMIGIDTPETVDPRTTVQCFGKEASDKAKSLLTGKKVRIEMDASQGERDKYDRLLAYVYRDDGLFFNDYMVKEGYAHEYTYNLPYKYQTQFKADQKAAQTAQKGLWSPTTCNGDTSSSASASSQTTSSGTQTAGKYYTSSYSTSKYYYPADCSAWQGLSPSYLKSFDTLDALLAAYPSRSLSPQCQ